MTAPLWSLTAAEIARGIAERRFGAREVVAAALARLDAVNPSLNAVVQRMDAEALAAADALDAALARGTPPGALAGVPVTVKVNIDLAGQATTNGLRLQAGLIAAEDSPPVANLRRAGAIIIGRTNTPAFSLRWFTRNSLHGATRNPRDPGLTPGGSSGGAGASVAAGIGALAHGTDIAGSIRYPAYACGVHGLRPTLGRVPAFNATQGDRLIGGQLMAVSGPLARSVEDLALGLAALSAPDLRDPWWQPMPLQGAPAPARVALCPAPDGMAVAPPVRAALQAAADRLTDAGYEVAELPTPPWAEAMEAQLRLWMAEFHHAGFGIVAREADPDAAFVAARMRARLPEPTLAALMDDLKTRARLVRLWRGFLAEWPLVLCPVSGEPPFADHRDVASDADFAAVLAAQMPMIAPPLMGLPGIAVAGAPVGVQLLAGPWREDLLLAAARVLAPEPVAPVTPAF
ncbi:MAG: amidase [Gemmobacter sp.]|uniref:amidase n=1 Tax=Gemmobacter sp. TaxID=1898957 RepID=UPI0039199FCB